MLLTFVAGHFVERSHQLAIKGFNGTHISPATLCNAVAAIAAVAIKCGHTGQDQEELATPTVDLLAFLRCL